MKQYKLTTPVTARESTEVGQPFPAEVRQTAIDRALGLALPGKPVDIFEDDKHIARVWADGGIEFQ